MTTKTINGPRISVQFEISGTEDNETLAEMKKVEAEWEIIFANIFKKQVELAIKEDNSISEATKVAIQMKEANKNIELTVRNNVCENCKFFSKSYGDYPCRDCTEVSDYYEEK